MNYLSHPGRKRASRGRIPSNWTHRCECIDPRSDSSSVRRARRRRVIYRRRIARLRLPRKPISTSVGALILLFLRRFPFFPPFFFLLSRVCPLPFHRNTRSKLSILRVGSHRHSLPCFARVSTVRKVELECSSRHDRGERDAGTRSRFNERFSFAPIDQCGDVAATSSRTSIRERRTRDTSGKAKGWLEILAGRWWLRNSKKTDQFDVRDVSRRIEDGHPKYRSLGSE